MPSRRRSDTPAPAARLQRSQRPGLWIKVVPWRFLPSNFPALLSGLLLSGGGVPKKFVCVPKSILFDDGWMEITKVFICANQNIGAGQVHHGEFLRQNFLHAVINLLALLVIQGNQLLLH